MLFAGGCPSLQDPRAQRGRASGPGVTKALHPELGCSRLRSWRYQMIPGVPGKSSTRKPAGTSLPWKCCPQLLGAPGAPAGPGEGLHCPFSLSIHVQAAAELFPKSILVPGISTQSFPPAPAVPSSSHTRTNTPSTPSGKTPSPGTARPSQGSPALPPCLGKGVEGGDGAGRKREQSLAPQTSKSSSAGAFGTV